MKAAIRCGVALSRHRRRTRQLPPGRGARQAGEGGGRDASAGQRRQRRDAGKPCRARRQRGRRSPCSMRIALHVAGRDVAGLGHQRHREHDLTDCFRLVGGQAGRLATRKSFATSISAMARVSCFPVTLPDLLPSIARRVSLTSRPTCMSPETPSPRVTPKLQ